MKLDETALEAAAQVHWIDESFRENTAAPDAVVKAVANAVTDYLDALDAEGLADLHEYWSERVKALPVSEVLKGDTYAVAMNETNESRWYVNTASHDLGKRKLRRVLRRAPQPRQWKIGDLVDDTRDLPEGAVVRDESGDIAEHDGYRGFLVGGTAGVFGLDYLDNPRIIWLPENGDES